MYDKTIVLPIEFEYKTLRTTVKLDMDLTVAQKEILHNLNTLDEIMMEAMHHTEVVQKQRIRWLDQFIKIKEFSVGDWDFLYESRYKDYKGKL